MASLYPAPDYNEKDQTQPGVPAWDARTGGQPGRPLSQEPFEPSPSGGVETMESTSVERPPLDPIPNPIPYNPPPAGQPTYGASVASGGSISGANPVPLSPTDERTWAMISHASILANLVTGFLGPIIPLVIYLVYKDRSRYVAYQSLQAFVFQMIWWVGAGFVAAVAWTISGVLAVILVGCLLMPFALLVSLMPIAALVYGVIGALQANEGRDFRYWLIGDWLRTTYTG